MEEHSAPDGISDKEIKQVVEKKPMNGMIIVGVNLAALAVYTIPIKWAIANTSGDGIGGLIMNAFILFIHVIFCLCMALGLKSWIWLLSALLVLVIGFSTCVMIGTYHIR